MQTLVKVGNKTIASEKGDRFFSIGTTYFYVPKDVTKTSDKYRNSRFKTNILKSEYDRLVASLNYIKKVEGKLVSFIVK